MAGIFLSLLLALFILFGDANSTDNPSTSACHCRPVINVAVEGNQCDLCAANKQLLQEVHNMKKELETVKNQISTIQPGKWGVGEEKESISNVIMIGTNIPIPLFVVVCSQWNLKKSAEFGNLSVAASFSRRKTAYESRPSQENGLLYCHPLTSICFCWLWKTASDMRQVLKNISWTIAQIEQ